ncbi:MAG TPA: YafY family protein [Terriglobales bacterium]|nr:YafY family protein [Terriglobales bacterium]
MRRADRLFDIIQALRRAGGPLTAAQLAEQLEVTVRTVYRDIASLQASRVPIEGAAGLGYMLRQGFDLPPLMFTRDEIEAILVGARLIKRTGDPGLQAAAEGVLSKLSVALPPHLRDHLDLAPVYVSPAGAVTPQQADLNDIRTAIRDRRKLRLSYVDAEGQATDRVVLPLAIAYFVEATLLCGWCELRQGQRNFRLDRIREMALLEDSFAAEHPRLMAEWLASQQQSPA